MSGRRAVGGVAAVRSLIAPAGPAHRARHAASMNDTQQQRSALVFGARNLGRAVIERLRADGWAVAAVARSESTLATAEAAGALAMAGDITDPGSVRAPCRRRPRRTAASTSFSTRRPPTAARAAARSAAGRWPRPRRTRSTPGRPRRLAPPSPSSRSPAASRSIRRGPATLIQVTGGSARRAMPGRGLWAAGAFGVRAITQAAALELREQGIHVALLIVDAGIEPFEGGGREGVDRGGAGRPARDRRRRASSWPSRARAPRRTSCRSRRWPRRWVP